MIRSDARKRLEEEAATSGPSIEWMRHMVERNGYVMVKPGQAVTADGVVCDIEKEAKAYIKGVTYRSCVLRPVVDLPEGGTS